MTSSFVNYYVSPQSPEVYEKPDTDEPSYQKRALIQRIFSGGSMTNMNFIDKLYIASLIAKRRQQDYVVLRSTVKRDADDGSRIFSEKAFQKKYKGFFYHQNLREEGMGVQLRYGNYKSAATLSRIIEGQGIRVVDLATTNRYEVHRCLVRTNENVSLHTVRFFVSAFGCDVESGETEGVDIIVYLGKELENVWE
ncbi:MAG: hypothetical protein UZ22_OP11002000680 [Microgenomates bacterium OLB23]|nr:MAG: hypothetical protein UZ22_OP11002000680 [Microgenomates bacterium OLB23]